MGIRNDSVFFLSSMMLEHDEQSTGKSPKSLLSIAKHLLSDRFEPIRSESQLQLQPRCPDGIEAYVHM